MARYGLAALNQNLNPSLSNNFGVLNAVNQLGINKAVRVLSIVLDETHPRFKELGEWNALGIIEYEDIVNPLPSKSNPLNLGAISVKRSSALRLDHALVISFLHGLQ